MSANLPAERLVGELRAQALAFGQELRRLRIVARYPVEFLLVFGKNVKKIGQRAFAGNKALNKLIIKSGKLTSKKSVRNCLLDSSVKKVVVRCTKTLRTKTAKAFSNSKWTGKSVIVR